MDRAERLIYRDRVSRDFARKVVAIADRLEIDPNWLMAVMYFETQYSFRPDVRSPYSTAIGLIQFTAATARDLGTTTAELARMTAVEQLDYVEQYFRPYHGRLQSLEDTYMAVFWPRGIGRPNDYVLFQKGSAAYDANRYLDAEGKGYITKHDAARHVREAYERGRLALA